MKKLTITLFLMALFSNTTKAQNIPSNAEDISPMLIGETLPNAHLQDTNGNDIELINILKTKPTVLVFYRGGWCPYCNLQLSGLVDIEKDVLALGYQIVAISPDDYQNLKSTEEKDKINYQLYADKDGTFIQEIGIAFQTPLMVKGYIATKGQKGKTSEVLPVPTVMIVNTNGEILFEYINPNYKQRISGDMLLAVLKTIK
jgi:peroxiredoxin